MMIQFFVSLIIFKGVSATMTELPMTRFITNDLMSGLYPSAGALMITLEKQSLLECAVICSSTDGCKSVFYHDDSNTCYLHSDVYTTSSSVTALPTTLYMDNTVGIWNAWTAWTKCSATCGSGSRSRTRTCDLTSGLTAPCLGASQEYDNSCNSYSCSPPAQTCADWMTRGMSESDLSVHINPDGSGSQFGTVTVPCDFDSDPGKAITILHHNQEARTYVRGFETCGSYSAKLTYTVGNEEAKMVADLSTGCTQYVKWDCYHAELSWPSYANACTSWKNRNMVKSTYFTGPHPSGKYCTCGETDTCSTPSYHCNCDTNDWQWRFDDGNVTNKDDLPIMEFNAGDTGEMTETGYHTIGPMYCY